MFPKKRQPFRKISLTSNFIPKFSGSLGTSAWKEVGGGIGRVVAFFYVWAPQLLTHVWLYAKLPVHKVSSRSSVLFMAATRATLNLQNGRLKFVDYRGLKPTSMLNHKPSIY